MCTVSTRALGSRIAIAESNALSGSSIVEEFGPEFFDRVMIAVLGGAASCAPAPPSPPTPAPTRVFNDGAGIGPGRRSEYPIGACQAMTAPRERMQVACDDLPLPKLPSLVVFPQRDRPDHAPSEMCTDGSQRVRIRSRTVNRGIGYSHLAGARASFGQDPGPHLG